MDMVITFVIKMFLVKDPKFSGFLALDHWATCLLDEMQYCFMWRLL